MLVMNSRISAFVAGLLVFALPVLADEIKG